MRLLCGMLMAAAFLIAGTASAHADSLGQEEVFNVNAFYDVADSSEVSATLRHIGQHAYYYIDDRAWSRYTSAERSDVSDQLVRLSDSFDDSIVPRSRALWGTEAMPGVDGDPRVTVLIERLLPGNGGYFDEVNGHLKSEAPDSNEREMFVLSATSLLDGRAHTFLAHEFQHLISYNRRELAGKSSDDIWLNEARSEYNITAAGFSDPFQGSSLQRRAQAFARNPSDSLVDWPNASTDYAITALFAHYLAERYGPDILAHGVSSEKNGVESLDEWLALKGLPERTGGVFADWMTAVSLNDRSAGANYGYAAPGLASVRIPPSRTAVIDGTEQLSWDMEVRELQPAWVRITVKNGRTVPPVLSFRIDGDGTVPWVGTVIADYGGSLSVIPWKSSSRSQVIAVPTINNGRTLTTATMAVTQDSVRRVGKRIITAQPVSVTAVLGDTFAPVDGEDSEAAVVEPQNGDLVRRSGQSEAYVVWEGYRRYLPQGVLELYGFHDRPVYEVSDEVFFGLTPSNYIRAQDGTQVYAVWPDGTKHWLNITPAQWDASGRDWGAIFTVNDREVDFYRTAEDIGR